MENKMKPLIIDTDIGTDIDDALAIIYAVANDIDIKLITTVHGNAMQRAKNIYISYYITVLSIFEKWHK
jgi:inosine-uridine nucleoside N-ribohydrolase